MKRTRLWIAVSLLAIFCVVGAIAWRGCNNSNPASNASDSIKIAIAWRADTTSEFFTNVVEAFRAVGVEAVILPQVKAEYISYYGEQVAAACLDSADIGFLAAEYGAMVREKGYEASNAASVLAGVNGVVFTGGEDISPTLYAVPEDWHHIEAEIDYNAARDVSEYLTMAYCLGHDIPVIGFCRGAQLLGVVSGATMVQDIPSWLASQGLPYDNEHRREKSEEEAYRDYTPHTVSVTPGSLFSKFCTATTLLNCPSWHHQAILSVEGTPLRRTGTTTTSGVDMIEVVERTDKTCALGLQFHPEAAIAKHLGKGINNANADQFMSYDEAIAIIKTFTDFCRLKIED